MYIPYLIKYKKNHCSQIMNKPTPPVRDSYYKKVLVFYIFILVFID